MQSIAAQDRDANRQPFGGSDLPFLVSKRITFAGGTTDAIGDHDGALDPFTIFNVTGDVLVNVFAICKTTLVGAGTLEVGLPTSTAILLQQIADATTFLVNEFWGSDNTPDLGQAIASAPRGIAGGQDIVGTVGTANITAGVVDFYAQWRPLSTDGLVAAAS